MYRIIVFLIVFVTSNVAAQSSDTSKAGTFKVTKQNYEVISSDSTLTTVDQMPQFPGGELLLMQWITENVKLPDSLRYYNIGISGTVYIQFIIDEIGNVNNATLLGGIGQPYNEIALNAVRSMPQWEPAKKDGRDVAIRFVLPIKFTVK